MGISRSKLEIVPKFGALAVLFPALILKNPRPKEDLIFLVPKLSSSAVREELGDLGGRVVTLLNSSNALL